MRNDRGFKPKIAPVKEGDEIEVKIEAVGEKGDGIAKKDGFVLFVPGTKQGQDVRIKVTRVLRNVGFAEVVGEAKGQTEEAGEESSESQEYDSSQESSDSNESEESQDSEDFGEEDK